MKLRTFHALCYLCLLCTSAVSQKTDGEDQPVSNLSQKAEETPDANTLRDKRALGLILSGLAQVFGYTVNPVVQVASLPNADPNEARTTQSSNGNQSTTPTSSTTTTAAPRQRETIRFTGVVNFGNRTGLLTHLQQYEQMFHGANSSTTSQPPSTSSSTQAPQMDVRTPSPNQPLLPPLLVRIPLPAMPEPPLPSMPQPPLPEIPPQDIRLSYPEPYVPIRQQQEMVFRKNESTEKLMVENKNIYSGKDVQSPPPPTTFVPYTENPQWKKEYEDRLAELERKQEEQAHRLMVQEWYRNRQKDNNYSGEKIGKEYDNQEKQIFHENNDPECREKQKDNSKEEKSAEEKDESRERYESGERVNQYSSAEKTREPEESQEEEEEEKEKYKYKEYEDTPLGIENYTSIRYSEPLPLSDDDEHRQPGELRNSYGELLHNRELFDDGFVNYFGKFKEPLSDFYSLSTPPNSKGEISKNSKEDSRGENKNESGERSKEEEEEEEDPPARNKYEEYSLEEDTNTRRNDAKVSNGDFSKRPMKQSNNISSNDESKSYFEERKTSEELDFTRYMPLIVPVRYLSAPEELRKISKAFTTGKSDHDNHTAKTESTKKVLSKESRSKKENLKITASLPERPKKLHEGEQKEIQIWPAPFDFVLDSTIHTNVVPATSISNNNINVSNTRRKSGSSGKRKGERKQQHGTRITVVNSTRSPGNISEVVHYQDSEKGTEHDQFPRKQLTFNGSINPKQSTSTRTEVEKTKSDSDRIEMPDLWDRYRYTYDNYYEDTKQPNIETLPSTEQIPSTPQLKKFESLKRSIEKPKLTAGNHYSELYPAGNKGQINAKTHRLPNIELIQPKIEPTIYNPRPYNFYDFSENYGLDYGKGNERMSAVFKSNEKVGDEEAIALIAPQQDVYHYDESFTKFASEPENKNKKAIGGNYAKGAVTMRILEQKQFNSNEPISYVDYSGIL